MPIYEYKCQSCGHKKEALQKMSDDLLTDCPECGKPDLKKLISAVAFRLKGSGWYETDFKSGKKKNIAGSEESKPAKSESTQSTTKTTKSESTKSSSQKKA